MRAFGPIRNSLPRRSRRRAAPLFAVAAAILLARQGRPSGPPPVEIHLKSGGIDRSCLVHAPAGLGSGPVPLLLALHGGGGTAEGMIRLTRGRFDELADRDRFVVVYPQGFGKSWNDGRNDLPSKARQENVDDVAFFRILIDELAKKYPIDRRRVFVAGISNGAMMSLRLGCSLAGSVRGVAAVAGSLPADVVGFCPATSSVNLVLIDGTADPIVPYGGGMVRVLWSNRGRVIGAEPTAALWAQGAGCRAAPPRGELPDRTSDGTHVSRIGYAGCDTGARVILYRVAGGGHTWPGGAPYLGERLVGKTSGNLSACDAIWELFGSIR